VIGHRRLTQAAAAEKLSINQPKVSALANYKLDGFSVEPLMTFLKSRSRGPRRGYRRSRPSLVLPNSLRAALHL
jgi:hypothetical protein